MTFDEMLKKMFEDVETERYELEGRDDIVDIIRKHFPRHASKAREIKYDGIFANIIAFPSTAIVTPHKNGIEMNLHSRDENQFDYICGNFRMKVKKDGSLVVSKKDSTDFWKPVYEAKPSQSC